MHSVFCFGLWGAPLPKLLERSSAAALLLFCSGSRCYGHVPRGQWALLDADILASIDQSVHLVELCTCDWRIKCSPHGLLEVAFVSPIVRSSAPRSLGTFPLIETEGS